MAREHWPLKFTEPRIPLNKLYSGVPIIGPQSLDVRSKYFGFVAYNDSKFISTTKPAPIQRHFSLERHLD